MAKFESNTEHLRNLIDEFYKM
jgi:WD40 repeat protein